MTTKAEKYPLHGVRILDFSWVLAGPYATRVLADFGAEVIKIQSPQSEASDSYSRGYYNTWNRNKLGLCIDLSQPTGREIIKKLVKISDVVVENFSPRVMTNWGMDYKHLKEIKENVIMLSLSVMGHGGPSENYTGFGPTVQALSGMTALTAYPGKPPSGPGFSYADHIAGLYGSLAIMGALEYRRRCGQGQYIDLSQTETLASLINGSFLECTRNSKSIQPAGNRFEKMLTKGVYACLGMDKWCAITIATQEEWQAFKKALGNPAWAEDVRFCDEQSRKRNADELDTLINQWTSQKRAEEVETLLQTAGIAATAVKNSLDLMQDSQLNSREFFIHLKQSKMGETTADASPIRLSESPAVYKRAAPEKGQDSDHVLREILGMTKSEIHDLQQARVIL